jgi:hypothetical protein
MGKDSLTVTAITCATPGPYEEAAKRLACSAKEFDIRLCRFPLHGALSHQQACRARPKVLWDALTGPLGRESDILLLLDADCQFVDRPDWEKMGKGPAGCFFWRGHYLPGTLWARCDDRGKKIVNDWMETTNRMPLTTVSADLAAFNLLYTKARNWMSAGVPPAWVWLPLRAWNIDFPRLEPVIRHDLMGKKHRHDFNKELIRGKA